RFYMQGDELVPAKGYHGTLKKNGESNAFDFYTKDGTRYHYRRYGFNNSRTWSLAYIENVNGNQVFLDYDQSQTNEKLLSVRDGAGRVLLFSDRDEHAEGSGGVPVVSGISGPEGYQVDYLYDDHDRLISVTTRNNGSDKVETYTYPGVGGGYEDIYDYY